MYRKFMVTKTKTAPFLVGVVVALAGLFGVSMTAVSRVSAGTCDSDAIIYCGFTTPSQFISKVKGNNSGNGHSDLQAIYNHYGLPTSEYSDFLSHAVEGTTYLDGRVLVNGKVVAIGGMSIGREASMQGAGYFTQVINGAKYYGNTNARVFAAGTSAIPIYVLFDAQGQMKFAVMKACGNPVFGTVVHTSASCNSLTKTAVPGQLNTYDFTAKANTAGNATVTKYVYDFGDGSPTVTTTSGTKAVRHTYTKAGNFTAKVTEYASVPGNSNLKLPVVSTCTKAVAVTLPFYTCVSLSGAILDRSKFQYSFTAAAKYGNGANFTSADFVYGDGTTQMGVKPTGAAVAVTHAYAKAGTYNISAMLHFTVSGKAVTAHTCTATVTPTTAPTPTCKPGVPVGSPECTPCQYDTSLPSNSPQCLPPELPNTGAGNTIVIFGAVVTAGFLVYRQLLFRRHKAAFLAAQTGSSPLPLADPLSDQPLAGTPLAPAPKRRSFRRPRHF